MAPRRSPSKSEVVPVLLELFAANGAMNQHLMAHIDPQAWRASPPAENRSDGRTVAAIFAHMHNNRLVWIARSAPHLKCPARLDPASCTIPQTRAAHRQSAARCLEMLKDALSNSARRRVTTFSRGSWAAAWPAGATMFGYMFAHDAHHRGQAIMLAHQLGYRMPDDTADDIWKWDTLWKKCGFTTGPR